MINLSAVALPLAFGKSIYSQISPCRHPAITDTPIIWTAVKFQAKINYRDLTEINSRYCGLEVHELEVPTVSTIKRVGCITSCTAQFRRRSTHVPILTDELSTVKERRLNQFGTAVLAWCGKSVKFDKVCRTFVELNLGSTHGTPSESDVAPVSLQSRTYSVGFGT